MFKNFIKRTSLLLSLFVFLIIGKNFLQADGNNFSSSGTGTQNDPYIVSTPDQFKNLASLDGNYRASYFKLANDIDLNNEKISSVPKVRYFDGDYHVIKNFSIEENSSDVSLFSGIDTNQINNVGIYNATIKVNLSATNCNDIRIAVLASWGGSINSFVRNSTITITGTKNNSGSIYAAPLIAVVNSPVVNCYAADNYADYSNCHTNFKSLGCLTATSQGGSVANCFASFKGSNLGSGMTTYALCACGNLTATDSYYNSTTIGNSSLSGATPISKSNMQGPNALTNMSNLGNAFRTTENSWPVLKAFDTKVNSLSFSDGKEKYEIDLATAPLVIKLNLSNTLNQQTQGDKIFLYDGETKIGETTSENEISIPTETLENMKLGEHKLQAKVFDWNSNALSICEQKLTLTIKEPPAPNVSEILLSSTSHSRSHPEQLTSFTVNLTGQSFSKSCNVTLRFKNKSTGDETDIDCGNFSSSNTNSQILSVTGNNLNTIKNLPVGKYTVQAVITK